MVVTGTGCRSEPMKSLIDTDQDRQGEYRVYSGRTIHRGRNVCVVRARVKGTRCRGALSAVDKRTLSRCPQARRRFPSRVTVPSPPAGVTAPTKCGGRLCVP